MKKKYDNFTRAKDIYDKGLPLITYENLSLLATYARKVLKYGDTRIEKLLIQYCEDCEETFSAITGNVFLNSALRSSKTRNLRDIHSVEIFVNEIEEIKKIKDFKAQVFVLSCLVYSKANYPNSNKFFINVHSAVDILELCGMRISIDQFIKNHYFLIKSVNLLKHYYGKEFFEILIPKNEIGEVAIVFNDFRNIYRKYVDFLGKEIFFCKSCGKEVEKTGNRHAFCKECYGLKKKKEVNNNARKYYHSNKK